MKINKSFLGIAGEFAVAAELCRRGAYAQPTLGHQKQTDLLVFADSGRMARIEVKAKQGPDWPQCRGVHGNGAFLVFVDFAHKAPDQRPDYYVLTSEDWYDYVIEQMNRYKSKHPNRRSEVTDARLLILPDEVNRFGKPYTGCGVRPDRIVRSRETWHKINDYLSAIAYEG